MRKIAHLSDIHFGSVDHSLLEPLERSVNGLEPDLVAVSGDLTQRARTAQFKEARAFLDRLPKPRIVVPGNHDIPLYNIYRRFIEPLSKYRRYITDDLSPTFFDEEIAVVGINTARSLTIKSGRINEEQIAWTREKLCDLDTGIIKIIVTHHPFDLPEGGEDDIVGRAPLAIKTLAECGADLFLAGHMHTIHTGHTAARYGTPSHSALVVQAGTAASTRRRGETNSFNLISVGRLQIAIERYTWQPEANEFSRTAGEEFEREGSIWRPLSPSRSPF
jgi:3',5'-cyclic AMP phosphodiesterase CpdA